MTMRGISKWILLIVFVAAVGWLIFRGFERPIAQKSSTGKELARDHLGIHALDSLMQAHPDLRDHPMALIFFNPDCEFCQKEGKSLASHIDLFKNNNIVFLAADSRKAIQTYADSCGLAGLPSVYLIRANNFEVFKAMGALSVPHLVLFGPDGSLRHEFDGVTDPEKIRDNLY